MPRRPDPTPPERVRQALRLRASSVSYAQVAIECGYSSEGAARQSLRRFMAKEDQGARDDYRAIHRERVETLLRALWIPAVNPGMAQQAARENAQPAPPDQARAIELLIRLLDSLARVEGLYAPVRAVLSGAAGGPIEGRVDVFAWAPDDAFLLRYARVLKEAGLLDEDDVEDARPLHPGPSDPEVDVE